MYFWFSATEREKLDLLKEIEKLKEKIEYEKQPNIAFESENEALQSQVSERFYGRGYVVCDLTSSTVEQFTCRDPYTYQFSGAKDFDVFLLFRNKLKKHCINLESEPI